MQNRRDFLKKAGIGGGLLLTGSFPWQSLAGGTVKRLTILHTNDVHSRMEPFGEDGGKFAGQGGVAARAAVIRQIRAEGHPVLLLDAGDIFQGTPYFNLYHGEPEIKAMSAMGYDACTMGNHDFDAGVEGFARQLPHASFPVLTANYDFTGTALEGKTQPYTVLKRDGLKIGIFGLGIQLKGLVAPEAFGKTQYEDPVYVARKMSDRLRKKEKCDMVICLSHLGYSYNTGKISDRILAKETEGIDLIIGGHTHTFLDEPAVITNKKNEEVIVNQVGWAGLRLGRLDYEFGSKKKASLLKSHTVILGKQTNVS